MFGELIGAWLAQVWADQGRPDPFVLAELGPGRGTLMRDALRAGAAMPGFRDAARLWLVETSPALAGAAGRCARRRRTVGRPGRGTAAGAAVRRRQRVLRRAADPPGPAHRRALARAAGRARRRPAAAGMGVAAAGRRCCEARFPRLPDGAVAELNLAGEAIAARLGARIADAGRRGADHRLRRLGRLRRHAAGAAPACGGRSARRAGHRGSDRARPLPGAGRGGAAGAGAWDAGAGGLPRALGISARARGAGARPRRRDRRARSPPRIAA